VAELANILNGELEGPKVETVLGVSKIDQSIPNSLSFLANPKYEEHLITTEASVVLVKRDYVAPAAAQKTLLRVDDPYSAFCTVLNTYFNPGVDKNGIDPSAVIADSAVLGEDCYIGANVVIDEGVKLGDNVKIFPNCYIGAGSKIGDNALIYSNVSIYHETSIGKNFIVHSGTVIGSDGFGHAPQKDGTYIKIPQIGNVVIGDDVEIGSNCSIDRATMGSTIINDGVRLDNLIQVAHNVEIGANSVIASQTGISGSTSLGERCVVGGQVGFAGHLKIANGTQVGAQSGLRKSVTEENQRLFGSPVQPLKDELRSQIAFRDLPKIKDKVYAVEREIQKLKESK